MVELLSARVKNRPYRRLEGIFPGQFPPTKPKCSPQRVQSFDEIRNADLADDQPVPEAAIDHCRQWLEQTLDAEIRDYHSRCAMLKRHREIGDANKAFMYMLACGMMKSASRRQNVRDPEKPNQVIAEAKEMAEEDRLIIFDLNIDQMPETQKRDLIVQLGSEVHSNQWRSTPHFRQAAMHVIVRERGLLRGRGQEEATTSQLINQLWRKAEALLSTDGVG